MANKRISKFSLVLFGLIMVCLALAFGIAGYYIFVKVSSNLKYIALVLLAIIALVSLVFGVIILIVSSGMNFGFRTQKDTNPVKNNTNVRICQVCGTRVGKKAVYCHNCGAVVDDEDAIKTCPQCKAKNRRTAHFCERCGKSLEETEE